MSAHGAGRRTSYIVATLLAAAAASSAAPPAIAQQVAHQQFRFDIPAKPVPQAVNDIGRTAGLSVVLRENTPIAKLGQPVQGVMTAEQALATLLAGTGLSYRFSNPTTVTILGPDEAGGGAGDGDPNSLGTVVVQSGPSTSTMSLPPAYAGGQVATGGQLGMLGNRDIFSTPFNTANYTEKTIEDQQAKTVGDLVANDPSVRVVSSIPNGSEVFFIRGFSVSNANVAFDGLFGIYPYWKGSIASAERVEVIKGPGALLFGMAPGGGVGGTINVVPKRADDEPLTRVFGNYMSQSNFGAQVDIGRRYGTDNEFGVRVNGVFRGGESFRETSQQQGEATLGLDYRGDRFRASLDVGYLNLQNSGTEGLLSAATSIIPAPPDASKQIFPSWTFYNSQALYGVARAEYDILENVTAYAAIGGRDYSDQYVLPFGRLMQPNGDFVQAFTFGHEYWNAWSGEAGIRSKFQTGVLQHQLSVNASSVNLENGSVYASLPTYASNIYFPTPRLEPILPNLGPIPKVAQSTLDSAAIADTISMLDERIQLTAGVRYQNVTAQNFSAVTGLMTSDYAANAVTPAFGLVVKPWEKVSLYANYIQGLAQGGIAPAGTVNAGEVFPPYVSKQVEGGVKVDFGQFATTVSLFEITQPSAFTDTATNTYVVNGEQRNTGVEINLFGELTESFRILGGAMVVDAVLVRTANGAFDGNTAVNVPQTNVNLGFEWDTPFVRGLTLTARGIYTGSVFANQANTQVVPAWTRYDLGARYTFDRPDGKPVTLVANVINVLDTTYWSSSSLYRGAPRTLMLSTVFDF